MARVVRVMRTHLEGYGWNMKESRKGPDEPDLILTHGEETLVVEATGRTTAPMTDVDVMWGRMVRHVSAYADARFAVVVPTELVSRTLDVGPHLRELLKVVVYEVTDDDRVIEHAPAVPGQEASDTPGQVTERTPRLSGDV